MSLEPSPNAGVQLQLDAYNAHDLDAWIATCAPDAQQFEHPAKLLASGMDAICDRAALTWFTHHISNAMAEGLNSKVATIQKRACGYRNPAHFKIAVYFHCGGLALWPQRWVHGKF